jgi:hypothetical protein
MRMPAPGALRPALFCAALATLPLLHTSAHAQNNPDLRCIQQYNLVLGKNALDATNAAVVATGCQQVASALAADWATNALLGPAPDVNPRDLSATRDQTTAAPGDATTPIEPVEAAGGSVAAVGTDKGAGAVAAIAINPSIFFVDPSRPEDVARWSRFTDVTLLVPASDLEGDGGGDEDEEGTDYVGIRWGLNFTGLRRGSDVHQAVVAAYDRFLSGQTIQINQIQALLKAAPTEDKLNTCIKALETAQTLDAVTQDLITLACGGTPDPDKPVVVAGFREAIEAARIQADSRYFGLDLRADFGDLSLAGIDTVSGTSIFGGVGWGRRSVRGTDAAMGLRVHAGGRYWDTEDDDEENAEDEDDANFALEGGVALEAIRFYDYQRLTLVAGLDGRYQSMGLGDDEDQASINLRGSLNVPVTATSSVSLNLVAPVVGERRGPVLSIKANWRLLRSPSF